MTIERDSWRMIEIIIRRYPAKKREYEEYISDVMGAALEVGHHNSFGSSADDYAKPQSVTEAKALKMTSAYADRLKKEIEAVEFVYNGLNAEEQKVMREMYWHNRRKNVPYERMVEINYSTRQMKRIVKKIVCQVGRYLGEVK